MRDKSKDRYAFYVVVDPDLHEALKQKSDETGVSVSFVARRAWEAWVTTNHLAPRNERLAADKLSDDNLARSAKSDDEPDWAMVEAINDFLAEHPMESDPVLDRMQYLSDREDQW